MHLFLFSAVFAFSLCHTVANASRPAPLRSVRRQLSGDHVEKHFRLQKRSRSSDVEVEQKETIYSFDHVRIHRRTLILGGMLVHGADDVFVWNRINKRWQSGDIFECPYSSTTLPPFSVDPGSLGLSQNDSLTMYYRVVPEATEPCPIQAIYSVVPASHRAQDRIAKIYDASSGELVQIRSLTWHDLAYTYESYGPKKQPTLKELNNIVPQITNGGVGLTGVNFRPLRACSAYKCAGSVNGNCNEDGSICVDDKKGLIEGTDYFTSQYSQRVDATSLYRDFDWASKGYANSTVWIVFKNAMVAAPRIKKPDNGIWGSDIDFSSYLFSNPDDKFVELQVYDYFERHKVFLEDLMEIPRGSFCFIGSGPNCTQVDPKTQRTSTKWDRPTKIFTGMQTPDFFADRDGSVDFFTQLFAGKGTSLQNPIVISAYEGYSEAYFTSQDIQPPISPIEYRDCANGRCITIEKLFEDYEFFAFGKSDEGDWALSECISYHELTHQMVNHFIPGMNSYAWDSEIGLYSSDTGALNEGWADYFAAIHCGIADFSKKTYNKRPRRSLDNERTCSDANGQVHWDSSSFSGGLWSIRSELSGDSEKKAFDRVVLAALASATGPTITIRSQFTRILDLIMIHPTLKSYTDTAQREFDKRELKCVREIEYAESLNLNYWLNNPLFAANTLLSTMAVQILLRPKRSDWSIALNWEPLDLHPLLGPLKIGRAVDPVLVVVSRDCKIVLEGSGGDYYPKSGCTGERLSWQNATGKWQMELQPDGASYYLLIAHNYKTSMMLANLQLSVGGMQRNWMIVQIMSGSVSIIIVLAIGLYQLFKWRKLRNDSLNGVKTSDSHKNEEPLSPANIDVDGETTDGRERVVGEGKDDATANKTVELETNMAVMNATSRQDGLSGTSPTINSSNGSPDEANSSKERTGYIRACDLESTGEVTVGSPMAEKGDNYFWNQLSKVQRYLVLSCATFLICNVVITIWCSLGLAYGVIRFISYWTSFLYCIPIVVVDSIVIYMHLKRHPDDGTPSFMLQHIGTTVAFAIMSVVSIGLAFFRNATVGVHAFFMALYITTVLSHGIFASRRAFEWLIEKKIDVVSK